jgi:hypothetical protein
MVLVDSRVHFEHAQAIRSDIKPGLVDRFRQFDNFRKYATIFS